MKKLDRRNIGDLKEGDYWVYCSIVKKILLSTFDGRRFYYYNHHHPYDLQVSQVTHYKYIPKPRKVV